MQLDCILPILQIIFQFYVRPDIPFICGKAGLALMLLLCRIVGDFI